MWMACPASIQLIRQIPVAQEEPPNMYAQRGTCAHTVSEICLTKGSNPDEFLGTSIEGIKVDKEIVQHAQYYVDFVRDQQNEFEDCSLLVEPEIKVKFGSYETFGHVDSALYDTQTVICNDLKTGRWAVSAEENSQLMIYALGVIDMFTPKCKHVILNIVQNNSISSYRLNRAEIETFRLEVEDVMTDALGPTPSFGPGEETCRWCPAQPRCPALRELAIETARKEFSNLDIFLLSDEQLRQILDVADTIENWFSSIRGHVLRKLEHNETFDGYKLVHGRSNRTWVNPEEAELFLTQALGDEAFNSKLLSPAQAEKVTEVPVELVHKPTGKISLARDTDPRQEVSLTGGSEFSPITD